MKRFALTIGAVLTVWLFVTVQVTVLAANRGTQAEAKAMLAKAIDHYKSVGRKQALADFNARRPPFSDRDLYVFCISRDLVVTANGGFPETVGSSGEILRDESGRGTGSASWAETAETGEGVLRYRWVNPRTHDLETKVAFITRVGEDVCGVGAYLQH